MTTPKDNTPDRREAFRVDIKAAVALEPRDGTRTDPADYFQQLHTLSLYSHFQQLDQELNQVVDRIKDLATAKSIDILRRQVAALSKINTIKSMSDGDLTTRAVNISEGGCAFEMTTPVSIGDEFASAIIFHPSYFALFVFARVIDISQTDNGHQQIHLQFQEMTDKQNQQIMKHMFQAQTEQKKQ